MTTDADTLLASLWLNETKDLSNNVIVLLSQSEAKCVSAYTISGFMQKVYRCTEDVEMLWEQ